MIGGSNTMIIFILIFLFSFIFFLGFYVMNNNSTNKTPTNNRPTNNTDNTDNNTYNNTDNNTDNTPTNNMPTNNTSTNNTPSNNIPSNLLTNIISQSQIDSVDLTANSVTQIDTIDKNNYFNYHNKLWNISNPIKFDWRGIYETNNFIFPYYLNSFTDFDCTVIFDKGIFPVSLYQCLNRKKPCAGLIIIFGNAGGVMAADGIALSDLVNFLNSITNQTYIKYDKVLPNF